MQTDRTDIDPKILAQWQDVTNLLARLCDVPVSLIMRQNSDSMEVVAASQHGDSPYCLNETAPLNGDLYCEEVIRSQSPLYVPNALKDPRWEHNPDLELGMIAYSGVPINWPNGTAFGTLCILDRAEKHSTNEEKALLQQFSGIVETSLALLEANRKLENLSLQDGLTGIANRRLFDIVMNREWARSLREQQPLALLMCDIDFFKNYNNHLGHVKGDACLRQVAGALDAVTARQLDMCVRYGGEEFALLLPDTDSAMAMAIAEACRTKVMGLQLPPPSSLVADVVTISIGVAAVTASAAASPMALIDCADQALYLAKERGRNRVENAPGDCLAQFTPFATAFPA